MKAVILDLESLEDLELSALRAEFSELQAHMATTPEQLAERLAGVEVVITNKVVIDAASIARAPELKLICVVATGTNNIDLAAARSAGIQVCNCVAYGVDSVVQHVWALILALHTNLLNYDKAVKAGDWGRASQFCMLSFPIRELAGRTLGVFGYGNLGRGVARIGEAFGMRVLVGERPGQPVRDGRVAFEQLLAESDLISLHCPLTDETRDLFNAGTLVKMKPGSFLVNAARGGIVNEQALIEALQSGHLAGAATDVLSEEPPCNGNPLIDAQLDNLIVTPHSAWGSREARERILQQTVENIQAFKRGEALRSVL
ncbi:2-hydroxyacid dehydrogenase [Marinobacterium arenosum]|uniref:2-hydroxyacid dehydrogenase n=1 Tax=Marinobacterium arenosum TaxID=2862496 RepID=UPI001C9490AC|nr:2-hydroxyacid dehydrogenase [Marinobacterium arenosum]MBY4675284.1 2-hydroxyacid dehydrogenase [Marinobacterium arenosum]